VSQKIDPRELITGAKIDCNKHIRAAFGDCTQIHEEHDNLMKTRTTGAIATKTAGNAQGGFWFCSLTAGRMLDRMPQDVIDQVTMLARSDPIKVSWTDARNDPACEVDDDSDSDSNNESDDDDSDCDSNADNEDDDDSDDFIAGVEPPDVNLLDPPDENENVTENQQNEDVDDEEEDNEDEDGEVSTNNADNNNGNEEQETAKAEAPVAPASLKKLANAA
jgi:hypothetical protein